MGKIRIIESFRQRDYEIGLAERMLLNKIKNYEVYHIHDIKEPMYKTFEETKKRVKELNSYNNGLEKLFINMFNNKEWSLKSIKLKRNHPFLNQYFADFKDETNRIIIECDGPQHDDNYRNIADSRRDYLCSKIGYKVLRLNYKEKDEWKKQLFNFYENNKSINVQRYKDRVELQKIKSSKKSCKSIEKYLHKMKKRGKTIKVKKIETIDEYLKRGGVIKNLPKANKRQTL